MTPPTGEEATMSHRPEPWTPPAPQGYARAAGAVATVLALPTMTFAGASLSVTAWRYGFGD